MLLIAARRAHARRDDLCVQDLLAALLASPFGERIAPTVAPVDTWAVSELSAGTSRGLSLYIDQTLIVFERAAERLFRLGADRVLLGEYEPRHLAAAIGETAVTAAAPFARFGLDPQAWQRALSTNP